MLVYAVAGVCLVVGPLCHAVRRGVAAGERVAERGGGAPGGRRGRAGPGRGAEAAAECAALLQAQPRPRAPQEAPRPDLPEARLKQILEAMFEEAPPEERREMERRSELDKVRYEREYAEYLAKGGAAE